MIWDFIRDFFVQYIFGGYDSSGSIYDCSLGGGDWYTSDFMITLDGFTTVGGDVASYSLGDWLSTTATIICMALITWFCIWLVIWLFKLVSSAFLLRK